MNTTITADTIAGAPASASAGDGAWARTRRAAISGALWTAGGQAASHVLRLTSNLILTRLLVPEVFGLMALVSVFLAGLKMFSDIGIGPSIIQNERGDDPAFYNTAWTIQVGRGFMLLAACIVFAWPFALLYEQPALIWLVPAAGLSAMAAGFNSSALSSLNRRMALGRLTLLDTGTQVLTLVATVLIALVSPTAWAIVIGSLLGVVARAGLSHLLIGGYRNRFHWDAAAARSMIRFGRWIFIGSVVGFLYSQLDRLVLGRVVSMAELGLYSIAALLARSVVQLLNSVAERVLFPLYAQMLRGGEEGFARKMLRARAGLMVLSLPPLCLMAVFGPQLIDLLYDSRYTDAGWMLQILAVGGIFGAVTATSTPLLLAAGDSFRFMLTTAISAGLLLGCMALGGWLDGVRGVIIAVAAGQALAYVPIAWATRKWGGWQPLLDAAAVTVSGLLIWTGHLAFG